MNSRAKRALSADQAELLRQIPSVDELLQRPRLASLASRVDRALLLEITRAALADLREEISGENGISVVSVSANASSKVNVCTRISSPSSIFSGSHSKS